VFGLKPTDPLVLTMAAAILVAVALAAAAGPSLRAASVDPMTALRHE
jgi:ABC-type antimicrobial peptide transport system permease subunit